MKKSISVRLRRTEDIAKLCGFKYNAKVNPYGGFFTVIECETIIEKVNELNAMVKDKDAEIGILKARLGLPLGKKA